MKIGLTLPQFGEHASPEAVARVAVEAERLGYESHDPLETLAYAAAKTEKILLGTAVIDALFHSPVVLAKRLVTVDHFSGGRLIVLV